MNYQIATYFFTVYCKMFRLRLRKRQNAIRQFRRGATAVEFAVIAPLFFLLMAGIIEFGQAFRVQHSLSTAARHAARFAVVEGSTSSQVRQKAQDSCVKNLGVSPADVTVVITVNGTTNANLSQAEEGSEIAVTVTIPFTKAGVGFFANMFATKNLSSTCILEHE